MSPLEAGLLRTMVLIAGLSLGSFLAAAAYRIPRGMSLAGPRSHCPSCLHTLSAYDLFPVVSFILRRGRCAYCGAVISWRYPVIEACTGFTTLALFIRHGPGWAFAAYGILAYIAILLAAIDLEHHRLPNVITISGIGLGFVTNLLWYLAGGAAVALHPAPEWEMVWRGAFVDPRIWGDFEVLAPQFSPLHSLLGIVVGGGVLWLVAVISRGGMGGGDVKYLAAIGSFIGPGAALAVLFIASTLGAVVGIALIVTRRLQRREPIPFGPFLSIAVILLALVG